LALHPPLGRQHHGSAHSRGAQPSACNARRLSLRNAAHVIIIKVEAPRGGGHHAWASFRLTSVLSERIKTIRSAAFRTTASTGFCHTQATEPLLSASPDPRARASSIAATRAERRFRSPFRSKAAHTWH